MGTKDLSMYRGDTFELDLAITQPDGSVYDLTGGKVWSTIKRSYADADNAAVSQVDSSGGSTPVGGVVTITDAPNGKVTVRHAAAATLTLDSAQRTLVYDVQVRDALGRVFTVQIGNITMKPDVTQTES